MQQKKQKKKQEVEPISLDELIIRSSSQYQDRMLITLRIIGDQVEVIATSKLGSNEVIENNFLELHLDQHKKSRFQVMNYMG